MEGNPGKSLDPLEGMVRVRRSVTGRGGKKNNRLCKKKCKKENKACLSACRLSKMADPKFNMFKCRGVCIKDWRASLQSVQSSKRRRMRRRRH